MKTFKDREEKLKMRQLKGEIDKKVEYSYSFRKQSESRQNNNSHFNRVKPETDVLNNLSLEQRPNDFALDKVVLQGYAKAKVKEEQVSERICDIEAKAEVHTMNISTIIKHITKTVDPALKRFETLCTVVDNNKKDIKKLKSKLKEQKEEIQKLKKKIKQTELLYEVILTCKNYEEFSREVKKALRLKRKRLNIFDSDY